MFQMGFFFKFFLSDVDGSGLSAKWMGLGAGVVALLIFFIVTIIVCSVKKK